MILTFLGTGTSHGVPMIACSCPTCTSADPRDVRTNASVLISVGGKNILIDCGRDFHQQAVKHRLDRVDHVLLTHTHFDHIAGIDDLRVFTSRRREPIPVFGMQDHLAYLRTYIYHYLFDPNVQKGGGIADIDLVTVNGRFLLEGVLIEPLPVYHGSYFTHICHDVLHEEVEKDFSDPDSPYCSSLEVHLAYDGLRLEL
ncbi:Ribonuclease BN [subsurface metagenome]